MVLSSLPKNVVFSEQMHMRNAGYIFSIMLNSISGLGSVHILHHHVRGGGGPDTNDDIDDALRGEWGGNHQNDDVIYEWVLSELPCNLQTFVKHP